VARVATACGFEVRALSDPKAVGGVLASWQPEILTLDLCMPETDGIDLLAILEQARFAGALVIISGQDGWFRKVAIRLAETRGLNVADDLEKPIDIAALRRLLNRLRSAS
jgi:two-component system, chemotaxis family, chemotaxis protein CheY